VIACSLEQRWSDQDKELRWGKPQGVHDKLKLPTPLAILQPNVKFEVAAVGFRADLSYSQVEQSLRALAQQSAALAMRPPGHKLLLLKHTICGDGAKGCLERSA
jgi:hypothetical protein